MFSQDQTSAGVVATPLITQKVRYYMPEAGQVFLVWGIDGWNVVPEEDRPEGTIVENGVMHTPMAHQDGVFAAKVQVPPGTALDYGFQIRKTRAGTPIGWVWDGNYCAAPSEDNVIGVTSNLKLLVTQEIRYRMPEAGEVFLVWGVNGWANVPEERRPAGTTLKDGIMRTPMIYQGDAFVAKVQVPFGATVDYGFLITKTRGGAAVHIWEADGDCDYHVTVTNDRSVEVQTALTPGRDGAIGGVPKAGLPSLRRLGVIFGVGSPLAAGRDTNALDFKAQAHVSRLAYLRDLLRELVVRDMKLRYKRSVLGMAWSLLNPLFQMLVFVFLFRRVLSLDIPNYPLFVFSGVLAWGWFQTALSLSAGAITDNRELIRRPGFPSGILPVVTVTTHLIHFLLALSVLLLFLALGGGRLTSAILALPAVMALQFLLILSLGYVVATMQVTFRDTQHLLGVFLMLLFYLTPVFYEASIIPARYQTLYDLNPMVHLIAAYRAILIEGNLPDLQALVALGACVCGLLGFGYAVFTRASHRFVEEL